MNIKYFLLLINLMYVSVSFGAAGTESPDLLRIVCEEITGGGRRLDHVLIIDQLSSEVTTGSQILKDAMAKTKPVDFSLKIFKTNLDNSSSAPILNDQVENIIKNNTPVNNNGLGIVGEGFCLGNNFLLRYNGVDRVHFMLALYNLDGAGYKFNSRITTSSYNCKPPYTIPVPVAPQAPAEDMIIDTGLKEDSSI